MVVSLSVNITHCTFCLCSICMTEKEEKKRKGCTLHPLPTPPSPMLWQFEAENPSTLLTSTHERIPVKVPTEENGPCPLIYCLSQEEGLLMHLELTRCSETHLFALSIQYYSSPTKKTTTCSSVLKKICYLVVICPCWYLQRESLVTKNGLGNGCILHYNITAKVW